MASTAMTPAANLTGKLFRELMRKAQEGPARDHLGGLASTLTTAALMALPEAERTALLQESGGHGIGIEIIADAVVRAALLSLAYDLPTSVEAERRAS